MVDRSFVPGLELSRRFHDEVVRPILDARFPELRYSAARLDTGSELFGFDTARSTDHDWGPRLQVFLGPTDLSRAGAVHASLLDELPEEFLGYPIRSGGRHGVFVTSPSHWLGSRLGFDPRRGVDLVDWLALPTQRLAEVTGGAVFHDGLDDVLGAVRAALAWYPDDLWRYVLACQWTRVGQEEHLMARAGEVGDELGSAVLAGRLARDLMRLSLLLERRYPPYGKWLGTAFARSPSSAPVGRALTAALSATGWREREAQLCIAYEAVAARCNEAGLAAAVDPATRAFHDRPFRVLVAGRFGDALRAAITDPVLRHLPPYGAIDQYVDSTDVFGDMTLCRALTLAWVGTHDLPGRHGPNER